MAKLGLKYKLNLTTFSATHMTIPALLKGSLILQGGATQYKVYTPKSFRQTSLVFTGIRETSKVKSIYLNKTK